MLLKYLINMDRKTKIIATVGPSLLSEQKIHKVVQQGVDVLRLNFSHGTREKFSLDRKSTRLMKM